MSDIVLSASVRQNLLSLQSTADLLATTQTRLATGNKVNTALDNPTNYFTAQNLNSRASDINNLLDSIGNGVQVLQAANTGITSLQKLVDTAKSIANQALQTPLGYTKSSITSANNLGATATNLLGTTPATVNSFTGSVVNDNHTGTPASANAVGTAVTGTVTPMVDTPFTGTALKEADSATDISTGTTLNGAGGTAAGTIDFSALATKKLSINGVDITFSSTAATDPSGIDGDATSGFTVDVSATSAATLGGLLAKIDELAGNTSTATGEQSTVSGGKVVLHSGNATAYDFTGSDQEALDALGLTTAVTLGDHTGDLTTGTPVVSNVTASTALADLTTPPAAGSSFKVNDQTIQFFDSTAGGSAGSATDTTYVDIATDTMQKVLDGIDAGSGTTSTIVNGKITIPTGTTSDLDIEAGTTSALSAFGLTAGPTNRTYGPTTATPITGGTAALSGTATTTSTAIKTALTSTDTITVTQGSTTKTIGFFDSTKGETAGTTADDYIDVGTKTVDDVLAQIDTYTGTTTASSVGTNGKITINSGNTDDVTLGGTGLAALGLKATTIKASVAATTGLSGQTLTLGATGSSTTPVTITFGTNDAAGEVSTLDELNKQLLANNLQASIDTKGALTITTTNDSASSDIASIGGSITDTGNIFDGKTITSASANADSQSQRASLVSQYNNVIDQIRTTAQDSSFNGVNLLNGDQLKMVFNETGTSTLNITGVTFDPAGLGLGSLVGGTDFIDNTSTNTVLSALSAASTKLRSQASALGSNLSVVQVRQDFNKNLINVLQTGSSNLTLADSNEEAANSQALSTRQSIAVSALALANQSQQSILQLLR